MNSVSHLLSNLECWCSGSPGLWNVSLQPREGFLFHTRWHSLNTPLCPFWTQLHAEVFNQLMNRILFTTSVPRHRGLMPPLILPTGDAWSNLQSQGPLSGDKTENVQLQLSTPTEEPKLLMNSVSRGLIMLRVLFLSDIQIQGCRKLIADWAAASGPSVWMKETETTDITPHYDH